MGNKLDFLDLPAEIRNRIYKDYMTITANDNQDQRTNLQDLSKVAYRSIFHVTQKLQLPRYFPFLVANKQVMHEAFAFSLGACNFRLPALDMTATLVKVYRSLRLGVVPIAIHVRTVHITFIKKKDDLLVPYTLEMLREVCPRLETMRIFLDAATINMNSQVRQFLLRMDRWPSLREVEVNRPDLTNQLARIEWMYHGKCTHTRRTIRTIEPWKVPFRIPWLLEMDFMFLRRVNEDFDLIMRLRRGESLEDEDPSKKPIRACGLDLRL